MINISEARACGRLTSVLLKRDLSTCPSAAFVLQRPPGALVCQPALQGEWSSRSRPSYRLCSDETEVRSTAAEAPASALKNLLCAASALICSTQVFTGALKQSQYHDPGSESEVALHITRQQGQIDPLTNILHCLNKLLPTDIRWIDKHRKCENTFFFLNR